MVSLLKRIEKRGPYPASANLLLLTHAELLEKIDENWFNTISKDDQNDYAPSNLNYPRVLPVRKQEEYKEDCPITEFGNHMAFTLGEYLTHKGCRPRTIYTAPEMKCIQTAQAFIQGQRHAGFSSSLIAVEPALGEWRHKKLSKISVSPEEWLDSNESDYFIDKRYPTKFEYPQLLIAEESKEHYFERLFAGFTDILRKDLPHKAMFVIHPTTYLALAKEITNESEIFASVDAVKPCTIYGFYNLCTNRFNHAPRVCPAFTWSKNIVKSRAIQHFKPADNLANDKVGESSIVKNGSIQPLKPADNLANDKVGESKP